MLGALKGGIEKENLGSFCPVWLLKHDLEGKMDCSNGLEHPGQSQPCSKWNDFFSVLLEGNVPHFFKKSSMHP